MNDLKATSNSVKLDGAGTIPGAIAIVIMTLAAMLPVLRAPLVWDDDLYLTMNRTLSKPGGLADIWLKPYASPSPYPLVFTTYWFEHKAWGFEPAGYRIVNMLLHAAAACMLWRTLRQLRVPGAWLAGAVFAVHPVHVESVAHIAERKDVLSGFFYFVSLYYWIVHLKGGGRMAGVASFTAFLGAMLAKTVTCTLPPVMVLMTVWLKAPGHRERFILRTLPFFAVAFALGLYTVLWERHRTGATADVIPLDFIERALIAARAVWFYFWKLAWPANLVTLYPKWEVSPADSMQWIFPLGAAAAGLYCACRAHRRGVQSLVPAAYVLITLGPALGFVNFSTMYYSYVMDHYQYLACSGWIALFAAGFWTMTPRMGGAALCRAGSALLLAVLSFLSFQQSETFRSLVVMWDHNVRGNPESAAPRYDLGVALENEGRLDEAYRQFLEAVRLNPNHVDAYLHLGGIMRERGDLPAAERWFLWAARVEPDHPKARRSQANAHNNIGGIYVAQGRHEDAIRAFERALEINPHHADARLNIGVALSKAGRIEEAIAHYRRVVEEHPASTKAPVHLFQALRANRQLAEAREVLERAVASNPENIPARLALAQEELALGNAERAQSLAAEALAVDSTHAEANNLMGALMAMQGDPAAAIPYFERGLKTDPRNASLQTNLERAIRDARNRAAAARER